MGLIVVWLVLCGLVAFWANNRGQNGLVLFIVSVILSPLIGALIVLVMGDKSNASLPVLSPANSAATADAMTKLVGLHDAGHITEEEFQQQRAVLFPPATGVGLTVHNQALPNQVCGRCGKPLSTVWKGKCQHCGATYAMYPPVPR